MRAWVRWYRQRADRCQCGHTRTAHHHYRTGTDCARCACQRYRSTLLTLRERTHL